MGGKSLCSHTYFQYKNAQKTPPLIFSSKQEATFSPKFLQNTYAQTPNFFWFITQRGATLAKKIILSTFLDEIFTPFHFSPNKTFFRYISRKRALPSFQQTGRSLLDRFFLFKNHSRHKKIDK
jgi:hypothetical protein